VRVLCSKVLVTLSSRTSSVKDFWIKAAPAFEQVLVEHGIVGVARHADDPEARDQLGELRRHIRTTKSRHEVKRSNVQLLITEFFPAKSVRPGEIDREA
jgi:hypothetical protein